MLFHDKVTKRMLINTMKSKLTFLSIIISVLYHASKITSKEFTGAVVELIPINPIENGHPIEFYTRALEQVEQLVSEVTEKVKFTV